MAGIYVHIPFCRSFCIYCDFYSELFSRKGSESFFSSFSEECALRSSWAASSGGIDTLYFGGGTPSLLTLEMLGRMMACLADNFDLSGLVETTIEVNPDDVCSNPRDWLDGLKGLGFNRVSMGVQSFDDGILKWMNRRHDSREAVRAYSLLRDAGFDNISVDLIFGFAGLDDDIWMDTLAKTASLPGGAPEHVSAYCMSLEPGSTLTGLYREGKYAGMDDDAAAGQYSMLQKALAEAGYVQYEVSNFARPGKYSRHNSSYWKGVPYLGLGPSAHSLSITPDGRRMRSWNSPDLASYVAGNSLGGYELLTPEEEEEERIMLGLRCVSGARLEDGRAAPLVKDGLLVGLPDGFYRIPDDKLFISEYIIEKLL